MNQFCVSFILTLRRVSLIHIYDNKHYPRRVFFVRPDYVSALLKRMEAMTQLCMLLILKLHRACLNVTDYTLKKDI